MTRWTLRAALLVLAVSPALAQVDPELPRFHDRVDVTDNRPLIQPVARTDSVRVRFPVGELEVEARPVTELRTELDVRCRELSVARCESYRRRLRLEGDHRDGVVEVRLVGLPRWKLRKLELDGRVTVPDWAPLEVHVGIGDVDIRSGSRDLVVTMGIGDLTVRVPEQAVGSVRARTGIGDASLRGFAARSGKRRRLVGAAVDWSEGSGEARVAVGLRIGDATVVLE